MVNDFGKQMNQMYKVKAAVNCMKIATWNVRGIDTKEEELVRELCKRKMDVAIISRKKKEITRK